MSERRSRGAYLSAVFVHDFGTKERKNEISKFGVFTMVRTVEKKPFK